jgi:RNA polymerase sigma-70 factor, ECF subfamily
MEHDEPTDAQLVARSLAGDREAFGGLYDRYARLVRAVVLRVAGDWSVVQDLTQECYLRAYQKLARLRQPDRFGRWIVGIARQVARERRRSVRRDRHRFTATDVLDTPRDMDVADELQTKEEITVLMQRLEELPERERLAIHVFFLQERNAGQTAQLLGLSRSGVYALLERGLTRLAGSIRDAREK